MAQFNEGKDTNELEQLIYWNWTRTQNHLVRKRSLNHLANLVHCSFTNEVGLGSSPVTVT